MKILILFTFFVSTYSHAEDADANTTELLDEKFRLNGLSTQDAFGSAREKALSSTVRLVRNDKLIALGGIVRFEDHFEKLIVEAGPLGTGRFFKDFKYFGGSLWETNVEAGPLGTGPLLKAFQHFEDPSGRLIVEAGPFGTGRSLR